MQRKNTNMSDSDSDSSSDGAPSAINSRASWAKLASERISRRNNRSMRTSTSTSFTGGSAEMNSSDSNRLLWSILSDDGDGADPPALVSSANSSLNYNNGDGGVRAPRVSRLSRVRSMENMPFYPTSVEVTNEEEVVGDKSENCCIMWWRKPGQNRDKFAMAAAIAFITLVVLITPIALVLTKKTDGDAMSQVINNVEASIVEGHFSQSIEVEDYIQFDEEEVDVYEGLFQSYTAKYGTHEHIITTCKVYKQRLMGEWRYSSTLILTFTIEFESTSGYDISTYPTLFEEYIKSSIDEVAIDMQHLSLPVVQVKGVVLLQSAPDNGHRERSRKPSLRPTMPPLKPDTTSTNINTCITFQESNLVDCEATQHCNPSIGMHGNIAVISKHNEYVQFFSKAGDPDEKLQVIAEFDANDLESLAINDVAVSDNTVVFGAASENNHTGAVGVIERDPALGMWLRLAHVAPDEVIRGLEFGSSVDIDRGFMVIGAPNDGVGKGGSAYIFRHTEAGWLQEAKLAVETESSVEFGASSSIKGDIVAVGDYMHRGDVISEGAVFLYRRHTSSGSDDPVVNTTWLPVGNAITNEDCGGWFGSSLSLTTDGGLLVGCPKNGAIYYYVQHETGYNLQQKIAVSSDESAQEQLGERGQLAVDDINMIAGTKSLSNGRVYVFTLVDGVWKEISKIDARPGVDYFGSRVALSGKNILISSKTGVYSYTLGDCSSSFASDKQNATTAAPTLHLASLLPSLTSKPTIKPTVATSNPSPSSKPAANGTASQPSAHSSISVAPSGQPSPNTQTMSSAAPSVQVSSPLPSLTTKPAIESSTSPSFNATATATTNPSPSFKPIDNDTTPRPSLRTLISVAPSSQTSPNTQKMPSNIPSKSPKPTNTPTIAPPTFPEDESVQSYPSTKPSTTSTVSSPYIPSNHTAGSNLHQPSANPSISDAPSTQ